MLENEIDKMLNNSDSADSHNHKRKSLGRGLGALLGEDDLDLDNVEDLSSLAPAPATANLVDIDLIKPGKFQPRTEFDHCTGSLPKTSSSKKATLSALTWGPYMKGSMGTRPVPSPWGMFPPRRPACCG